MRLRSCLHCNLSGRGAAAAPVDRSAYGTAYGAGAVHPGIEDDAQMNREWATEQLDAFLGHTEFYRRPDPPGVVNFTSQLSTRGAQHDIVASAQVVEQIVMAGRQVESAAKFGSLLCRGAI